MLIVELTYKKSIDDVMNSLEQHKLYLSKYYDKGIFIASGPKEPRNGGIIFALTDKDTMNNIIQEDPFFTEDIADYTIVEFKPNRSILALKNII